MVCIVTLFWMDRLSEIIEQVKMDTGCGAKDKGTTDREEDMKHLRNT